MGYSCRLTRHRGKQQSEKNNKTGPLEKGSPEKNAKRRTGETEEGTGEMIPPIFQWKEKYSYSAGVGAGDSGVAGAGVSGVVEVGAAGFSGAGATSSRRTSRMVDSWALWVLEI